MREGLVGWKSRLGPSCIDVEMINQPPFMKYMALVSSVYSSISTASHSSQQEAVV
jgi:hypothetical protein